MTLDKTKSETKYPFNIKCVHEFTVYAATEEEAKTEAQKEIKKKKNINNDLRIEYVSPVMSLNEIISSD